MSLPLFEDSAVFLKHIPKIDKNILIVVVENFENLVYFKSQTKYFQDDDILFVYRNNKMRELITQIENKIIYFGDFDLEGINIYLNDIYPRNNNISLFIPKNIKYLIQEYGLNKLYKKQLHKCQNLKSDIKPIQELIDTIHDTQRSLEQEWFI
jgi:hypothetical protein